jgi:hypothetical protein
VQNSETFYLVAPRWGRSVTDNGWEFVEPAHIKLWKDAVEQLATLHVNTLDAQYIIEADWAQILRVHERSYAALKYLFSNKSAGSLDQRLKRARFPKRAVKSDITIRTNKKGKLRTHLVENFICDIFLIMNLTAPGSCDFHGASLSGERFSEVSLSNYHFEMDLNIFLEKKWPISRILSLDNVLRWYRGIRDGVSQLPQNPMERVLFALLHLRRRTHRQ